MENVLDEVSLLSRMNKELDAETIESLKGQSEKYTNRLQNIAENTFCRGDLLDGTTVSRPSVMVFGRKNRLQRLIMPIGFGMYVRTMPTTEGRLVMFPMHTIGTTDEGQPIINPDIRNSFTIGHIPNTADSASYNPAGMKFDLVFTVDDDNLVTKNGQNTVSPQEYELFNAIVEEFERCVYGKVPENSFNGSELVN